MTLHSLGLLISDDTSYWMVADLLHQHLRVGFIMIMSLRLHVWRHHNFQMQLLHAVSTATALY
uniref:Uncharacterized protein n=1 Tax=Oryza brachyantha TaxID=4533 RepID=J3LLW3_ORYBR